RVRRVEDQARYRFSCRKRDRHSGAERFADGDDAVGAIAEGQSLGVACIRIAMQPYLARRSGGTEIAAIADRQEAVAAGSQGVETRCPFGQAPAVALKIKQERLARRCRNEPRGEAL